MSAKLPRVDVWAPNAGAKSVFQVVIAYEDFTAGKRALDACKLLVAHLGADVQFRSGMWKFDLLRNARLNEIAIGDAVDADLIIVATGENPELPAEVKEWVGAWAPRKRGQTAALVALVDFPADEMSSPDVERASLVHAWLKQAAATAGIDFLPQAVHLTETHLPPQDRIISRPAPEGWGLND